MMSITMGSMAPKKERPQQSAEMDAAAELVRMVKEQGLALIIESVWNLKIMYQEFIDAEARGVTGAAH